MGVPLLLVTDPPPVHLEQFPRLAPLVEPGRAMGPALAPDRPWAGFVRTLRGARMLIRRQEPHASRCLWIALPGREALEEWGPELAAAGYPLALAGGGMDARSIPWKRIRALIVGRLEGELAAAAKRRGVWLHVREVSSAGRVRDAVRQGVDSIDAGEPARRWPSQHIPRLERALVREGGQLLLPFDRPAARTLRKPPTGRTSRKAKLPPAPLSSPGVVDPFDAAPIHAITVFKVKESIGWPRKASRYALSDRHHGALSADCYDLVARIVCRHPYRLDGGKIVVELGALPVELDAEAALIAAETGGFGLRRLP